jgi:glycosyltransferase involved in cell wall biosynthesis
MRIAMLAPPWYAVPPQAYGGIEALVAGLVDGLHRAGHDVLLISAGSNGTKAPGAATSAEPASTQLGDETPALLHVLRAQEIIADFAPDVVHDHTVIGPSLAHRRPCPTVTTVHGRISGYYGQLLAHQRDVHPVAISDSQRRSAPHLPWLATVRNGIPVSAFPFDARKNDDLVFLGRMHPDKGVAEAITVAEDSGRRLRIAARLLGSAEEA